MVMRIFWALTELSSWQGGTGKGIGAIVHVVAVVAHDKGLHALVEGTQLDGAAAVIRKLEQRSPAGREIPIGTGEGDVQHDVVFCRQVDPQSTHLLAYFGHIGGVGRVVDKRIHKLVHHKAIAVHQTAVDAFDFFLGLLFLQKLLTILPSTVSSSLLVIGLSRYSCTPREMAFCA